MDRDERENFLRQLSHKTKILIATAIVLVGGGIGTAATISDHQEQVKTVRSALHQQIDDLSDFQSSEYLPLTYAKAIDAQVEESGKKHDTLKKYSDIAQIKSETKRVKKESDKARALIAKNESNQTLLESSLATAEAYIQDKDISSENKEKLSELLKVCRKNITDKTFETFEAQNDSLKTASEQVKVQIDLTGADSVRNSQEILELTKTAQDLLESTFTSETDKQSLNSDLANMTAAKTEKTVNSAVVALKKTITATQKHNKPAEDKAKAAAEKKAAEEAKVAATIAEAERKAAEAAQATETANVNQTAANKWAIEDGYTWQTRKGHSTVVPPGGSLPPNYHWQVP
ncbi:hypothetical protein RyT2_04910 [Pseudolactococcus yaeyamensis]